jgi:hypothetical protein
MPPEKMPLAEYSDFTVRALDQLRDPSTFQWSTITLFAICVYIYSVEIEARRWPVVFAGVGFLLMDIFNETVNALVLHFTDRAAIWTTTGDTSYQLLVGLNIEIVLMFSIAGIAFVKMLPKDRGARILGMPNRFANVLGFSLFSVFVEVLLHELGVFHWPHWWWGWPAVPLIVILGYMPFYGMAAWLYDMGDNRKRQLKAIGTVAAIDGSALLLFGPILQWI